MSPAPQPPSRSPPRRSHTPAPPRQAILPPTRRASRSFVLAAPRLRALHLDPLPRRRPASNCRGSPRTPRQRPPSSERAVLSIQLPPNLPPSARRRTRVVSLFFNDTATA